MDYRPHLRVNPLEASFTARFSCSQGDKAGRCYAEWTTGHTCPEGFETDSYDFYALTPASGAFTVSVAPSMGDPDLYINAGRYANQIYTNSLL